MAISSMFRRALNLIPSVASTAKDGFTRVLSFTGSFNDRTSLLLAAAPEPVPDDEQEPTTPEAPPPVTTSVAFDIEAATPPETLAGGGDGQNQETATTAQDAEAKRVAKTVQTVCLFAASASLVLFVNLPSKPATAAVHDHEADHEQAGAVLYSVDMAFICLGLFTSLGLSMFSIVARPGTDDDPAVARVQKRAMVMAVAFVLVSFTLRMCMMLPPASMESSAWLVFVLLSGAVAVYLALAWKLGGRGRGPSANRV